MRSYKILKKEDAEKIRLLRPPELHGINEKTRTIEHIITTDSPDRDGDIIAADGWDLKEFEENPVVLFGHRHDEEPIARNIEIKVMENGLKAITQFPPEGIHERADRLFKLNKLGFIRGWSVGFLPIEDGPREDGRPGVYFKKQKLLEYSNVPIPSNMEAVNLAVSKGLVTAKDIDILGWQELGENICKGFKKALGHRVIEKGPTQFADLSIVEEAWNPRGVSDADLVNAILGVAPGENISDRDPDTLNWDALKKVYLWWDPEAFEAADSAQGKKDAFKLKIGRRDPITDTGGTLKVYFQQLASRIAILNGARGGVDIPAADRQGAYNHAVKYYEKLDKEPPPLKTFSEIIQTEFSNRTNIMVLEAESQRLGHAFRKANGART